jgi:histidinol-phosphate aminotransferase
MTKALQSSGLFGINANIAALPAYNSGTSVAIARRLSGMDDIARLGSNENPDGCAPAVMEVLRSGGATPTRPVWRCGRRSARKRGSTRTRSSSATVLKN